MAMVSEALLCLRPALCSRSFVATAACSSSYTTLDSRASKAMEVKRSKFVANASPIDGEAAALAFLAEVGDPRATHNCWAYKIRDKYRFNDDGEPGGTAGRPIYSAIENSGLDGVMVVVTRYFGGIKLGTGGLVRAYGGVATECLKEAQIRLVKAKVRFKLQMGFDLLGTVYRVLDQHSLERKETFHDNDDGGGVSIELSVDEDRAEQLETALRNSCRSHATIQRL